MSKGKFKFFSIVLAGLLALVVLLNLTATFAWFSDRKQLKTETIEYGTIKLNANNAIGTGGYFASNTLSNVNAGDYVLNNDVTFSLDENSEPAYIRAKYKVKSVHGKNLFDVQDFYNFYVENCVNSGYSPTLIDGVLKVAGPTGYNWDTKQYYVYPFALEVGATYQMSYYGYCNRTDGNTTTRIQPITISGAKILNDASTYIGATTRTYYSYQFTVPADFAGFDLGYSYESFAYIDSIMLQKVEDGVALSEYVPYEGTTAENEMESYLKYGNMVVGVEGNIDYYWSDKIGDYYYLLDAQTGEPLIVDDSSKTYTFLTKENSKINENYVSKNTVSGTNVTLSIGLEAIQVANLVSSDTTKTTLENIQEKLDEVNNVSSSGTHSVTFVIDGTNYSVSGISYAGSASLPTEVVSKINETDFAGFALSKNGYPVITKQSKGHSWIDMTSGTINNITENLILYITSESDLVDEFDIVFKNGSNTIQTGKTTGGKAYFLGETPTKTSTSTVDYEFAGWKISGSDTVYSSLSNVIITQNTTFEASFVEKARTYEITYVLNGGAFEQSKLTNVSFTYSYGTAQNLPTSECMFRLNYTFAGWFENEDLSGTAVTSTTATQTGNKTYYAKWTDVSSTLTLNLNGGGYNGNTTAVTKKGMAGTTTIVQNPTRGDDYIFAGWRSDNFDYLEYGKLIRQDIVDGNYNISKLGSYKGTNVTRTKIEDSTSSTGYSYQISTPSTSSQIGGVVPANVLAKSHSRYYIKAVAKVPSGYSLCSTYNIAAGGIIQPISSTTATGNWQTYSWLITTSNLHAEEDGNDNIGYLYFDSQSVPADGFTWWLQSIEIYELENFDCLTYSFGSSNETLTAVWNYKSTPIEFDSQGGTVTAHGRWSRTTHYYSVGGVNAKATNVTFKNTTAIGSPNTSTSTISKTGYTFAGWWTGYGGTGSMLIDANGKLQAASGYTTATTSGAMWSRPAQDEPITLYAKWEVDLTTWEVTQNASYITNITANGITVSKENPSRWFSVKLKIPSLTVGVKYKVTYSYEIIANASIGAIDSYRMEISDGTQYFGDWSSGTQTITITDLTDYYYELRFYINYSGTSVTDGTTHTIRYYNIALTPVE